MLETGRQMLSMVVFVLQRYFVGRRKYRLRVVYAYCHGKINVGLPC